MHKLRRFILVPLLAALLAFPIFGERQGANAQETYEYVYETGHYVRGEILAYYRSIENPIELYGYPIAEAYLDTATGITAQYFEKARIEVHPAEPAASRVRLSPLGEYLYEKGLPEYPVENSAACQAFPPDGYLVCYDFLRFYLENGGPAQFGAPISGIEITKNDVKIQYFQNARLEFHPGRDGQSWVTPARLGWEYFYAIGEDSAKTAPVDPPPGGGIIKVEPIQRLQARAYPQLPVTTRRATQTIHILLNDQRCLPIEGADVWVVVHWPSGAESRYIATAATNARGITKVDFAVNSNEIGLVTIQVEGQYNRIPIKTVTSFRIWW